MTVLYFKCIGLTSWLAKGLDFWWFDSNWGWSIPPPGDWHSALCTNDPNSPCINGTGPAPGVIGPVTLR